MLRMLSSALGDRREKFSHASKRMAEGDVEPGRNTDTEDAGAIQHAYTGIQQAKRTVHFLHEIASVGSDDANAVRLRDDEC